MVGRWDVIIFGYTLLHVVGKIKIRKKKGIRNRKVNIERGNDNSKSNPSRDL